MSKQQLSVSHLTWQVGEQSILKDVSFSVNRGEVVGIVGTNGAGKTSLLKCVYKAITDFSGSIHFNHKPLANYSFRQLAQSIAVVAQQLPNSFQLSVQDVVKMGLTPHKSMFSVITDQDWQQIELAIKRVGLWDKNNALFNQLSGGEQQRALIARALVQRAKMLILDEPTNHLDVYYQHQILSLVHKLNITVLMTIHDLNLAAQYCQRILLLDKGQLVADGTPQEVLKEPLLEQVFRLPCRCWTEQQTGLHKVSFMSEDLC